MKWLKRVMLVCGAVLTVWVLMVVFPVLDPTRYSTKCARMSETDATNLARERLSNSIDVISKYIGEPPDGILGATVVEFFDWRTPLQYSYSIAFETRGHRLIDVSILPWCETDLFYPRHLYKRI